MKKYLTLVVFQIVFAVFAADTYVKQSGNKCILENKYLRVVVNAESGGRVESFTNLLTGKELTVLKSTSISAQGSGLCGERFSSGRNFEKATYKISDLKNKPDGGEVTLTCIVDGIKIEKTLILHKDKASLAVKYALSNLRKRNLVGNFWLVNMISPGRNPKVLKIYYPYGVYNNNFSRTGARQNTVLNYQPGQKEETFNYIVNYPAADWAGVLDGKGDGMVIEADYANLDKFYTYMPPADGFTRPTVEWFCSPLFLRPLADGIKESANRPELDNPLQDYIYKTKCAFMPVSGFPDIAACNKGIAAGIEQKGKNAVIYLCSDRKLSGVTLELQITGANKKSYAPLKLSNLNLEPGKTVKVNVSAQGLSVSDKLLSLKLTKSSGAKIASMSIPRFSESAADKFVVAAQGKKDKRFDPSKSAGKFGTNFSGKSIDWGKNLKRRLKVIAIYQYRGHREIAELGRRFNMDIVPVETERVHVFNLSRPAFVSWTVPDPALLLEKKLKEDFDAILIGGGLLWKGIPEKSRKEILKKIEGGKGLVFVNPRSSRDFESLVKAGKSDYMARGIPFKSIPGLEKFNTLRGIAETGRIGKGKVVLFEYNTVPYGKVWRTGPRGIVANIEDDKNTKVHYWEYYFSLAGRALRYVSGDEPEMQIVSASLKDLVIENNGNAVDAEVKIDLFNKEWKKVDSITKNIQLAKGDNKVGLSVDPKKMIMNGEYYANVFLNSKGKTCDWYSFVKVIDKAYGIEKLTLTKAAFPEISEVSGKCLVKGQAKGKLRIVLLDVYGRELDKKIYPASKGEISFSLKPEVAPLSILCWIRVDLMDDNKVLDFAEDYVTFNIPSHRDVKFIVWGTTEGSHWTKRLDLKLQKSIGFDWNTGFQAASANRVESDAVARSVLSAGISFMPLGIHGLRVSHANLENKVRNPCLRDPEYVKKMHSDISKAVEWSKDFFPPYYFVGDENSLGSYSKAHDFCFGPCCMAKFRVWLKEQYGSLEKLNREWDTNFKNWDAIIPETLAEAKKSGKWARWVDHRTFMFKALAEALALQHKTLKDLDPFTHGLAVSGMGEPMLHNGFDWYKMEKNLNLVVAYIRESGRIMDPMRSFIGKGDLLSAWNGYATSHELLTWKNWHEVINSFFAPSFWWANYLVNHGDCSISGDGKAMKKIINDIRASGIGKLLLEAERVPSQIAVLHSVSSLIATGVSGESGFVTNVNYNANLDGWSGLLRDCGFQPPNYVCGEDLIKGALDPAKVKVFILPLTQALGDKEIKALEKYVSDGGILLCDAIPGAYQLNGNPRKDNPLFKVFGCEYRNKQIGKTNKSIALSGRNVLPLTAASEYISLNGGKASAFTENKVKKISFGGMKIASGGKSKSKSIPAFIVNKYGKGTAIYLNALLCEYEGFRSVPGQSGKIVKALTGILTKNGVKAPGVSLPAGSELIRFKLGNVRIFAMDRILRAKADVTQFSVKLDNPGYIYDVRQKKLLGKSDTISGSIDPSATRIFAVLPEAAGKLSFTADKTNTGISFDISTSSPVVRTVLTSPDGKQYAHYSRNWLVKGRKQGNIELGANERHGKWKLTAQDVISGKITEKTIDFD